MTLDRSVVVPGVATEYADFATLLRGLPGAAWDATTRCEGWSVADVAGHVVGQLTDVANARFDGLGTPEVTQRQVDERRGRSAPELADELDASVAAVSGLLAAFDDEAWEADGPQGGSTLGFGVESLWFDTFLHADDIRAALGQATVAGPGILPSVSHLAAVLTSQGWGPATIELAGTPPFAVSGGGGRTVTGDSMAFILVASGRVDPSTLGLDEAVNIYR